MTSRFGFGFVFTLTAYDFEPQRSQNGGAVSIELHCRWHGLVGSVRTPIPTIGATPHRLVLITGIFRLEPFSPGQSKRAAVVMAGILIFGTFLAMPRRNHPGRTSVFSPAALAEPLKGLKPWEKLSHARPAADVCPSGARSTVTTDS